MEYMKRTGRHPVPGVGSRQAKRLVERRKQKTQKGIPDHKNLHPAVQELAVVQVVMFAVKSHIARQTSENRAGSGSENRTVGANAAGVSSGGNCRRAGGAGVVSGRRKECAVQCTGRRCSGNLPAGAAAGAAYAVFQWQAPRPAGNGAKRRQVRDICIREENQEV